jgi:hypothetical protein
MKGHKPHSLENMDRIFEDDKTQIWHYTCNSPKENVLKKYKITPIGFRYECADNREVLLIPLKLYESQFGKTEQDSNTFLLNCEILLRRLR